ncbi:helix-turn-helix domain-containing protein [Hymenobacter cellulosilyticus]|uniref:Helix-turn-helix domain-containing protein n=1 Tax=Hymenobacter cellulosilyticus TaxID=2932248 RepID=A0A8T9Q042_9BACT|nr:helix-turn-helix domain-containing protein [Hymenobacter cellulosilyticus]UOQ70212.1 helix-turn-helix domain-containing protein [Hymenobacter cellulosilyticus]
MQHQEVDPPDALRDTVQDFWYLSRDFHEEHPHWQVVPDGYAEIIFYFGSTCRVATPDGWQLLPSPFLVGLLPQPVLFQAESRIEFLGIKCFPWTVFELLGLLPGKEGVRVLTHPLAQLQAPLAKWLQAGNVAEALAQVAQYFEQAQAQVVQNRLLGQAGRAMRAANGTLPVSLVAAAAQATVRTLERKFKQAVGHTVKDVSGRLRVEQVRRLWLHPTANLAGLAHEFGYADQSHLGREFKRYSGTTPAAFARKAARWQQTVGTDIVAFVLA